MSEASKESDAPLLDRSPERPEEAKPDAPTGAAASVFTDEIGGAPVALDAPPRALPESARPGAIGAPPAKRPGTWRRLAKALRPSRRVEASLVAPSPAEVKGAPCPSCKKTIPEGCTACAFCGKSLPRVAPSLENVSPGMGSAIPVAREVVAGGYIPDALAPELEAKRLALAERDRAESARRGSNRRRILRAAPFLLAVPYIIGWYPGAGGSVAFWILALFEVLIAWASVRLIFRAEGGTLVGLTVGGPKVFLTLCFSWIVLAGRGTIPMLIASGPGLAAMGAVGALIETEFLELRKG